MNPEDQLQLSWDVDAIPPSFTATSTCGRVRATVTRKLVVTSVEILDSSDPGQLGEPIVEAVNLAMRAAEQLDVDELRQVQHSRISEFNAVLDGLESDAARSQSRIRSRFRLI